jgi:hypothetical protein
MFWLTATCRMTCDVSLAILFAGKQSFWVCCSFSKKSSCVLGFSGRKPPPSFSQLVLQLVLPHVPMCSCHLPHLPPHLPPDPPDGWAGPTLIRRRFNHASEPAELGTFDGELWRTIPKCSCVSAIRDYLDNRGIIVKATGQGNVMSTETFQVSPRSTFRLNWKALLHLNVSLRHYNVEIGSIVYSGRLCFGSTFPLSAPPPPPPSLIFGIFLRKLILYV